jgi:3-oxoacyl-[acyl-carrier protein] reductase
MSLEGKICLVTGGSRGIGEAVVRTLAAQCADVIFTYSKREDKARHLAQELNDQGLKASYFQVDVANRISVKALLDTIKLKWDRLDVLVNNAGINKPTDFDKISDEDWDDVLSVNLKGPFIVTQECLPMLKNSNNSSVINIGSVSGQYGGPRTAHYAASKAGLISLGQVIARFGAEFNIRSNTISAGLIQSEMAAAGLKSAAVLKASENILQKRFGTQGEVADVVAFLASESSSYITAQTINVNGGLYF